MLQVRLLGQFDVRRDGTPVTVPSRAAQSLFAYLILTAGTAHRREKLAGVLWPDTTEANARKLLRNELWRLRQAIETKTQRKKSAPYLIVDEISIAFGATAAYWLDVAIVLKPMPQQISADDLIETLAPYSGELLPGLYDDWVVLERERVHAVFEQKMARLLELLTEGKRWQEILDWGERWIARGQTPEPAYRALMLAHSAMGNRSQVAALYERAVHSMRDDLGVEPSEQTRALFEQLSKAENKTPVTPVHTNLPQQTRPSIETRHESVVERASPLPVPLTSFIGREKELKEIAGLLSASRLLTLTGSGGVGKTRLAIETAHAFIGKFKDGVFWVDLVGLSNANLIPQEIAQSLRVREVANVPMIKTLKNDLAAKHLLLILDNCEHVIAGAAQTAEQLLSACPSLKILATSRERLGIFNETVWPVPSLSETTRRKLFAERARAAQHDFTLTSANEPFVAHICARLDGIPLAIELAAARTAILSVEEIARRLDDRFALLTSGSRTALQRHQTLRATIDWSYDLLTEPERILFRRLAVFVGGFTLDAAETVCGQGELKRTNVLDALGRLVDKSLVIVEPVSTRTETRYRLLETIRQYALEKLTEIGETPAIRDQQLGFYLALAEESEPKLFGSEYAIWYHRLDQEVDNIRAAMEWSTHTGHADAALRILGSLAYFWFAHRPAAFEWHDWLQQALARPESKERTLARAKALNAIGFMNWADFNPTDTRPELEEALSISREFGDPWNTATALQFLGVLETIRGNYLEAHGDLEQSLVIWGEMGLDGKIGRAWTLNFLGDVALNRGEAELARSRYEEVVTILRETGEINFLAYAVRRLAQQQWREHNYEKAIVLCKESLYLNQQVDSPRGVLACLGGFAAIAMATETYEDAAQMMAAVETQVASLGVRLVYMDRMEYERNLAHLRTKLDEKTLAKLWAQGKAMTMEQAIAYTLSVMEDQRRSLRRMPHNLPAQLSSFIGRQKEIEEIKRLLASTRLLTLTGAGGVGKTRLALKVATELSNAFIDEVRWVELVALSDSALVPEAVAKALDVRALPNVPLIETLADALCPRQILLVLDNCEHLVAACAELAHSLLGACASLKILTTSREALGISGETVWPVPSLSLPEHEHLLPVAKLGEYEGIRLFVERARAVKTDFTLSDQNALPIIRICQRLDGIPLALELAAARIKTLAPQQIAARLDDRFQLLTQGSRTALPRHQTLRATMDWSYDLLSEPERILFRRVSVFAGGWTLEAAEAVTSDRSTVDGTLTTNHYSLSTRLDLLARLVDKSLVIVEEQGGETRYRMLETIRQYANEKLVEAKEDNAIHRQHVDYFVQLAGGAESHLSSGEQQIFLDRLELELDNLRTSVDWALENSQVIAALQLVSAIPRFWFIRAHHNEGLERLRAILALPEAMAPTPVRLKALNAYLFMLWPSGRLAEFQPLIEEALALGKQFGDRWNTASALLWHGVSDTAQGDFARARAHLEQSIDLYQELNDPTLAAWALLFLGEVELLQGDAARAQGLYEQAIPKLEETKDYPFLAIPRRRLGQLAMSQGDLIKANTLIQQSLADNWNVRDYRGVGACLAALGALSVAHGQSARAAKLFGAVDAVLEFMRTPILPFDRQEYERHLAKVRADLGDAAFAAAWAEGHAISLEQAVTFASSNIEARRKPTRTTHHTLPAQYR